MEYQHRDKKVAIIGLGYVGLPLSIQFARSGIRVLGLDIDTRKPSLLNAGQSYIKHIEADEIRSVVESGWFKASSDFALIQWVDAVIICVPTPLNRHREPDLSYIVQTGHSIAPYLAGSGGPSDGMPCPDADCQAWLAAGNATKPVDCKLVVLESTTYPGTTDTDLRKILEEGSGLQAGQGFNLAYSPEREDPGRRDYSVKTIPKVVGGLTRACLDRAASLYGSVVDKVHRVGSCRAAEATKLTENIFRSVNIALVNELKVVYEAMGIDVWEVIEAASTKPFGYMPFYPGPGLGGHCIPIDPFYLTWKAREYEKHTRFIELAGEINTSMPNYVVSKVVESLNRIGKSVNGSRILILGLAYKPDVDDDRESVSYVLMKKLEQLGASVAYNDPHIPEIEPTRNHSDLASRRSHPVEDAYDLILLATAHRDYVDFDFSGFEAVLLDTRNCVKHPPSRYFKA